MNFLNHINVITVIMIGLFLAPVIIGIIKPFRSLQLQRSIGSLLNNLLILVSVALSVYLASLLLSDNLLTQIYRVIPQLQNLVISHHLWVYAVFVFLLTVLILWLLRLLIMPVYTYGIVPVINKIASSFKKKDGLVRRLVWGLCQLPRSFVYVLVFSLLMNLYTSYNSSPKIDEKLNQSSTYQYVDKNLLDPLLNSSVVKKIPVLLNDSFKNASESLQNFHLVRYFNGMTLDDAVKSNAEIDSTAKKIVGNDTNSRDKAYLIYRWISANIKYDNEKATVIETDPSSVSSGAIAAFNTRTGICFDYACLYVAMCRAVDVKVRFITGLGYSGVEWGDHAWNQVYSSAENRWLNVDTTFGSSGKNYFDRAGFNADHQYAVIQGEW